MVLQGRDCHWIVRWASAGGRPSEVAPGMVDPSCVSCRVELATWRLRAVRCLASVSNNNQIPNRPDESIPDSTPEGPCRCHQRTTTAFRSGCGQARRRRSSLPPIRMEPRSTALPPRGNLWRTEVQCMVDTVFCTECRIQSTAWSGCEECPPQQRTHHGGLLQSFQLLAGEQKHRQPRFPVGVRGYITESRRRSVPIRTR